MSSLYKIQEDIYNIFSEIEENDGEITNEQAELLTIKEEELKDKLDSYYKAIQVWKKDFDTCKAEKKRINDVQKKYENRIERLKTSMLNAVLEFGNTGKSNKYIELPTVRLFTKKSQSVEEDGVRLHILLEELNRFVEEIVSSGTLYTGEDVDLYGILQAINANVIAEQGEDFKPFTIGDLLSIKVEINTTASIADLFKKHPDALRELGTNPYLTTIKNVTEKSEWKTAIELYEAVTEFIPTCAKIVTNEYLQIK